MSHAPDRPPRLFRASLRTLAHSELLRDAAADLDEEFVLQCADRGTRAARWWYRRQVLLSLLAALLVLLRAERLRLDLRNAIRSVHRDWQATLAVSMAIALALSAFTVLFALADPFTLRPLPYRDADRLVLIEFERGASPLTRIPTLQEWQARTDLFEAVAAYRRDQPFRLQTDLGSPTFRVAPVSHNFLAVLGLPGTLGGTWHHQSAPPPVTITTTGDTLLTSYAIPPSTPLHTIDGHTIARAEYLRTPLAFLSPFTHGLAAVDITDLLTIRWTDADRSGWSISNITNVIARLRPGVPVTAVASSLRDRDGPALSVGLVTEYIQGDLRPIATGALMTALVLLAICAGYVALFMAARVVDRRQEDSTRLALGAAPWQLLRLSCLEVCVLTGVSLTLSLLLSSVTLHQLHAILPAEYTPLGAPAVTTRVAIAAFLAAAVIVVAGVTPMAVTRPRTGLGSWRLVLASAQVALTLTLAVGAGLLVQSHRNLLAQDIGVAHDAFGVSVQGPSVLVEDTLRALARVPGVSAVAAATSRYQMRRDSTVPLPMLVRRVTRDYFAAIGSPTSPPDLHLDTGIVISTSVARQMADVDSPLGRPYSQGGQPADIRPIAGVTGDVFLNGLARPPSPAIFLPLSTATPMQAVDFIVRGDVDVTAIRQVIAQVNPHAESGMPQLLAEALSLTIRHRTFTTWLLTGVCVAGVLLSLASLWGMVAYLVSTRRHELAVRITLGATPANVRWLVSREALTTTIVGSVVGACLGHWAARYLESMLFQVEAGRWQTTLAASVLVVTLLVWAARLRSRAVNAIDPVHMLRRL